MAESRPTTTRKPPKKAVAPSGTVEKKPEVLDRPVASQKKGGDNLEKACHYGTGRRKSAVARVFLREGRGKVAINGRSCGDYFGPRTHWYFHVKKPLELVGMQNRFDAYITVKGGGMTGQAGAIVHGAARALIAFEETQNDSITLEAGLSHNTPIRDALKAAGYTTRDSRKVEPKKVGKHKARKGLQYSKR